MDKQNNESIDQQKNHSVNQKMFRNQPVLCPWISSQPYQSSLFNKNRNIKQSPSSLANHFSNNPWTNTSKHMEVPKTLSSMQQSSSQFFFFLRLMQLFPDTHPATLHTVLTLCKNDFFCAVDKLLYAKRCKALYYKRNVLQEIAFNSNKYQNNERIASKRENKLKCFENNSNVNMETVVKDGDREMADEPNTRNDICIGPPN